MKLGQTNSTVATLSLLAVGISSVLWLFLANKFPSISQEHGLMENVQVGCLLAGFGILLVHAWRIPEPGLRLTLAGAALLYFNMLLLEFDVRPFEVATLTQVFSGPIRNYWLSCVWLFFLVASFKNRSALIPAIRARATSSSGVLLMFAACFWVAGRVVEKLLVFGSKQQEMFAEELMENHASLIMLLAAIESRRFRPVFAPEPAPTACVPPAEVSLAVEPQAARTREESNRPVTG